MGVCELAADFLWNWYIDIDRGGLHFFIHLNSLAKGFNGSTLCPRINLDERKRGGKNFMPISHHC